MTAIAPSQVDTGWFEGIANVTGVQDRQLDTTLPGSFERTAADLNAGRVAWAITRQHSSDPADVVGYVTHAEEQPGGLWIRAAWTPDPVAQQLRAAVANGARLGLSITYVPRSVRPDGRGGRLLSDIDVTSIAITNDPANGGAYIRAGKGLLAAARPASPPAQVVTVEQGIQADRRDDDAGRRRQMAKVVAAAGWPPPELAAALGVDQAHALLVGAAELKARRQVDADPARRLERQRREQANRDSYAHLAAMRRLAEHGCGSCWHCQAGLRCSYSRA
jgi:HK97 family phage prohead protease